VGHTSDGVGYTYCAAALAGGGALAGAVQMTVEKDGSFCIWAKLAQAFSAYSAMVCICWVYVPAFGAGSTHERRCLRERCPAAEAITIERGVPGATDCAIGRSDHDTQSNL
jgi:hypothetical protein